VRSCHDVGKRLRARSRASRKAHFGACAAKLPPGRGSSIAWWLRRGGSWRLGEARRGAQPGKRTSLGRLALGDADLSRAQREWRTIEMARWWAGAQQRPPAWDCPSGVPPDITMRAQSWPVCLTGGSSPLVSWWRRSTARSCDSGRGNWRQIMSQPTSGVPLDNATSIVLPVSTRASCANTLTSDH